MISLDDAIPWVPPAPSRSSRGKKTCSSFNVQMTSSDAIPLQNNFMALVAMAMPIESVDMSSIPDSEPERRSSLVHKTSSTDSDSLPKMRNTGNADNKITPEDADDGSEFPNLDELLSISQWRERRARQKGTSFNVNPSLECTPEQFDRQTHSDNPSGSDQPVAGDSQDRVIVIDDDKISMASGNIKRKNGRVGSFDQNSITMASLHDREGGMEEMECGHDFNQRLLICLGQSEFVTLSNLVSPNNGSGSMSDLSYSNSDAPNVSKKRKKREKRQDRRRSPISNDRSLFMEGTATLTDAKLNGLDRDITSCGHIDGIEKDRWPPTKRRQESSSTTHSDAIRSHRASSISSKQFCDLKICMVGSPDYPIEIGDGTDNPTEVESHPINLDVTESDTEKVTESNEAPSTSTSPRPETSSRHPYRATLLLNQSVQSHSRLIDGSDEHSNILFDTDETLSNHNMGCQGRGDLVRKIDHPEPIFDNLPHDESQHRSETVWEYTHLVDHKIGDDERKYVKVQWEPTWEPLNELSGGEEAFNAYQKRQSGQV